MSFGQARPNDAVGQVRLKEVREKGEKRKTDQRSEKRNAK